MFRWSLVAVDEDGSERPVEVFAERRREAIEKARHAFWPVKEVRVVSAGIACAELWKNLETQTCDHPTPPLSDPGPKESGFGAVPAL